MMRFRSMCRRRYTIPNPYPNHFALLLHTQPCDSNPTISSVIQELVQAGHFLKALELYAHHFNHGFRPDNQTFPYILKASTQLGDPTSGFIIHNHAIKLGYDSNLFVGNSLLLFYGRFGWLEPMHYLFENMPQRNVVTWTAVISAFNQNHQPDLAVEFFNDMLVSGCRPNSFTMATLLPSFSCRQGSSQIHSFLIKSGFESDIFVSTAMIDVYAKCGFMFSARRVFDEIPERNLISWNSMMRGHAQNGDAKKSMQLFVEMRISGGLEPDSFSVVTALRCCASLVSLGQGMEIHGYVYRSGLERILIVGNGLVDMYGKCGALELAERVFYQMQKKDVSSWTALIICYGLNGQGAKAISLFEKMKKTRAVSPNSVTLIAVLSACSHSCLIEEGFGYFRDMSVDFGIEPTMIHYLCMVDMLGRAGFFQEALKFISEMPFQANAQIWEALLGPATIQGDRKVAEMAAKRLVELEPENPDLHVQLANIYAKAGQWEDVAKIRGRMNAMRLQKITGKSLVKVVK